MDTPSPISCDTYDYLELACLHGYDVDITLRDGAHVVGRANTTLIAEKIEYLVLIIDGQSQNVAMHEMVSLRVLTPNASFQSVTFAEHCGGD